MVLSPQLAYESEVLLTTFGKPVSSHTFRADTSSKNTAPSRPELPSGIRVKLPRELTKSRISHSSLKVRCCVCAWARLEWYPLILMVAPATKMLATSNRFVTRRPTLTDSFSNIQKREL